MTQEDVAIALTRCENDIKSLKHRVTNCESEHEITHQLALSVNQLAVNMEHMLREQKDQGARLSVLEKAPAESYTRLKHTVLQCLVSTLLGTLIGALATLIFR
ncbi:MAG: hypothetical protein IKC63_01530 [Clostridia bacterium]|nr:hypothetical protein [Clostridia bacterium]